MAWQPDPAQLAQLVGYLRDSLSGHDRRAQTYASKMLEQAKSSPDISNYLTYIFCSLPASFNLTTESIYLVRSSASLTLKNVIRNKYRAISQPNREYIRAAVPKCLEDPIASMRNFAGSIVTEVIKQGGVLGWPEIFPELLALASNERGNTSTQAQEGAMGALKKICEDNKKALDKEYQGERPLDVILPRLCHITTSPNTRVRAMALESINVFIPQKPKALLVSVDLLLDQLFRLASDPSDEVRRYVCRCFTQLVDVTPEKLLPHMEGLVNYMVAQQRNTDDPELALDAAEFWLSVGEHSSLCMSLGPYLSVIIPTLLESMVYGEEDIARLEGGLDDADVEDKEADLKPHFAKSKSTRIVSNGETAQGTNGAPGDQNQSIDDDLSEGEIEDSTDEDDGDEDPENEWNLRKCSAAALDTLATFFHKPVFEITLPYLRDNLTHQEWPNREAAVLAIGAVADGCMEVVSPHLPELVPFLISLLQDPEPVVRQITCWALGRYSRWAAHLPDNLKVKFFEPMMDGILKKMLDRNKAVQEAAASAFSSLEETAQKELTRYCKPIIQQFVLCFGIYKDRNMFILYDCVQTLAEHVGPALQDPESMGILMPALIDRWTKLSDQSRELFPLLECLSYVATALGDAFSPYAVPIFTRCVKIVHVNLEESVLAVNNVALDKPDKDFLVTSLDLLSSIIQALPEQKSGELVAKSRPPMFDLLRFCMEDPSNDVRQSSYALLGDCAIQIFPYLQPVLPSIMPVLIAQLDIDILPDEEADAAFSVINNACWSCGEIAIKQQQGMKPYVGKLYERLLNIISNIIIPNSVNENAAIALGRLGIYCAPELAPHLGAFAKRLLQIIKPVDGTDEKGQAFLGLNRTIINNPQAMEDCLLDYFQATAAFPAGTFRADNLKESFQQVLTGYKTMMPNFNGFISQLTPKEQQKLHAEYNL